VLSGLRDHLSFSLGQFHSDTNGFRENNDTENNFYNIFAQIAVMPGLNLQAEYRRRETEQGDIRLNFDPNDFLTRSWLQVLGSTKLSQINESEGHQFEPKMSNLESLKT
jgi:hypothetical protein